MRNISFIVIAPLLGYKSGNKKYLKLDAFQENVNKILKSFENPDIVVVTGMYNNEYCKIKSGFRICQNQLPFDSGEVEQIRLGLDNSIHNKVVILKEDCELNCESLKKNLKKVKDFIFIGKNTNNPGMIIRNNLIYNISFGINNYFGDIICINGNPQKIYPFVREMHNLNKKLYELANYLVTLEPVVSL